MANQRRADASPEKTNARAILCAFRSFAQSEEVRLQTYVQTLCLFLFSFIIVYKLIAGLRRSNVSPENTNARATICAIRLFFPIADNYLNLFSRLNIAERHNLVQIQCLAKEYECESGHLCDRSLGKS